MSLKNYFKVSAVNKAYRALDNYTAVRLRRWLRTGPPDPRLFSLVRVGRENPGLARHYLWDSNPMLTESSALWLHLGCGVTVLEGFVNLDVVPQDPRVIRWNLLDLWPEELEQKVEGVFSEDCLEHFFHAEQTYILCNINRALKSGGVARILMPSVARLFESYCTNSAIGGLLAGPYGVETTGDAINYGMRFTGHRWLHDQQSLARMATLCGFDATATSCASSGLEKFNGLNLRDESNSASFANDLHKTRHISRVLASPASVNGATKVEDLAADAALFVATSQRPVVEYSLPQSVASSSVACINFRSSNLSSFDWGLKTLVIDEINGVMPWYFDETLKSQPCMNLITKSQLKLPETGSDLLPRIDGQTGRGKSIAPAVLSGDRDFSTLKFSPAANSGEYFTLGCVEVFVLEPASTASNSN